MSIIRVGTNQKYAEGWESIFGGNKAASKKTTRAAKKSKKKGDASQEITSAHA